MVYPTFSLEYNLLGSGYKLVAGIDEVGRGCLAGPVVAGVVVVSGDEQYLPGVRDSKQMTKLQREKLFDVIIGKVADYGIGEASAVEIDEFGLSRAAKLAMERAYEQLRERPEITIVDGEFIVSPNIKSLKINDGDAKHYVVSAASVIAKVYRDRMMYDLAKKYDCYGFEKHVGYGTAAHLAAIAKFGVCEIHRRSFAPVAKYCK